VQRNGVQDKEAPFTPHCVALLLLQQHGHPQQAAWVVVEYRAVQGGSRKRFQSPVCRPGLLCNCSWPLIRYLKPQVSRLEIWFLFIPVFGCRFIAAAKAAAAAHQQEGPDTQSLPTLLSSAPLLLACDAASLDFWQASAASAERAETCPPPPTYYAHSAARSGRSASSWWPKPQLVGAVTPRPRSQAIEDVLVVAQEEEERRRQKITGAESQEAGAGGCLWVWVAPVGTGPV